MRRIEDVATGGPIRIIGETGTQSGVVFYDHAVTGAGQLRDDFRHQRDAPLTARNLSRDADQHSVALFAGMICRIK